MSALTKRQSQILSLVQSLTQTNGYPPTYRELMHLLGLSSPATLHKHIQNLIKNGHLKKNTRGWRELKTPKTHKTHNPSSKEIAIIGAISKGQKIELFAKASYFEVPPTLSTGSKSLYGFIINDGSFASQHMLKGDLIVVEAAKDPHSGEMVLARSAKNGAQIGRYLVEYSQSKLQTHLQEIDGQNSRNSLSFEKNDLQTQGVIVGLFRKYQVSESSSSESGSKSSKA
ncbi:MAG: hypothetical protein LLF94_08155 [Chlamydiales bacterium]|nr:hypothetical protein [Chlamydiales bacterium]